MILWSREKNQEFFFGLACFFLLTWFFVFFHPIIVIDSDDWAYINHIRGPFPGSGYWNPARVFPELLMPLVSGIAAYSIRFFVHGDYILALSIGFAVTVGAFVGLYCAAFLHFVHSRLEIHGWKALCLGLLFLVFHFIFFRTKLEGNAYLFGSSDATCYFYYTIPALLNGSLILFLLTDDLTEQFFNRKRMGLKALFLLLVYLCIFSNLFESVMLAAFVSVRTVLSLFKTEKRSWVGFFKTNSIRLLILLFWLISCIYEYTGKRANSLEEPESFWGACLTVCQKMARRVSEINRVFLVLIIIICALCLFLLFTRKRKEAGDYLPLFGEVLVNEIIVMVFVILLCARTGAARIERSEVILSCIFYFLIMLVIALARIIRMINQSALMLPLALFFLSFQMNTGGTTFQESNTMSWTPETCFAVSRDFVSQLQEADRTGAKSIILNVPLVRERESNWPFSYYGEYGEQRYAAALYEHGIISHEIETRINPSEEFNEKYGLFMDD